jgi:hypothetical protein
LRRQDFLLQKGISILIQSKVIAKSQKEERISVFLYIFQANLTPCVHKNATFPFKYRPTYFKQINPTLATIVFFVRKNLKISNEVTRANLGITTCDQVKWSRNSILF